MVKTLVEDTLVFKVILWGLDLFNCVLTVLDHRAGASFVADIGHLVDVHILHYDRSWQTYLS